MKPGAPASGEPGGHVGEEIWFASCTNNFCTRGRPEWVWVAAGIPSSMNNCGCDPKHIVVIKYKAVEHGREDELFSSS